MVDQEFRENQASGTLHEVPTSSPGQLATGSEDPRDRTSLPGDSGLCPRAFGVNQLSHENRACAGGPAVSTSCPG